MGDLRIVSRDQWGAKTPRNMTARNLGQIDAVVYHYADAPAVPADDADEEAFVRSIQAFHMGTRGWSDIAYNALVGMSGTVYAGRRNDVVPAHCLNFNVPSLGVCFLTNGGISPAAGAAGVQVVQMYEFVLHRRLAIFAHREKVQTGCPGDALFGWVQAVRRPGGPLAV